MGRAPISRAAKRRQIERNRCADLYRSTHGALPRPARTVNVRQFEPWSITERLFEHARAGGA